MAPSVVGARRRHSWPCTGTPTARTLWLATALLRALRGACSAAEVSIFTPEWYYDLHGVLIEDFLSVNGTRRDFPDVAVNRIRASYATWENVQSIQMYLTHSNVRVRASMDIFMMDVVYAPDLTGFAADLHQVLPGGADWFRDSSGGPRFVESILHSFRIDGRQVGLPDSVEIGLLFYRKDLMRRYGLCTCDTPRCRTLAPPMWDCDPPETWDELERMAKVIQDGERRSNEDFWGFLFLAEQGEGLMCRALELFASHADPADPALAGLDTDPIVLPSGQVVVNRNHTVAALRRMVKWFGYISPFPMRVWNEEKVNGEFGAGNGAFMLNWITTSERLWNCATCDATRGNTGMWRIPGLLPGLGRGTIGGFAYALSKDSDSPQAALALMQSFISSEAYARKQGSIPPILEFTGPRRPAGLCRTGCPSCSNACDVSVASPYAINRPALHMRPHYKEGSEIVYTLTWQVLNGELEPEEAALRMECGLVDLLHGANAQPERCRVRNQCGPGRSRVRGGCQACPPGKYAGLFMTFCQDCEVGFAAPTNGSSSCEGCLPGTFAGAPGATACTNCTAGHFQRTFAQSLCPPCEPGFVQTEQGMTACASCPAGKFQDLPGERSCSDCPSDKSTASAGSSDPASCVCRAGYYLRAGACLPCQEGLICEGADAEPTTQEGYFADVAANLPPEAFDGVATEFSVFTCFDRKACPGGPIGHCGEGRSGIACARCMDGYFTTTSGNCNRCRPWSNMVFLGSFCGILVVFGLIYHLSDRPDNNSPRLSTLLIGAVGSLLVTSIQHFSVISTVSVRWIDPLKTLLHVFTFATSYGLFHTDCLVRLTPVQTYLFSVCYIVIFAVLVTLIHVFFVILKHKARFRKRMHRLIFLLGTLLMVFMISTVNNCIAPFQCERHPNGLSSVRTYPTILCGSTKEHRVMVVLGVCFLLIPIGFLAACCIAVYQFPSRMNRGELGFLQAFGFLFVRFKPAYYWYILVFVLRNFAVAMAPMIPDTPVQVLVISGILLASLLLESLCLPWRARMANYLDILLSVIMVQFSYLTSFFIDADPGNVAILASIFVVVILTMPWLLLGYAALAYISLSRRKPYKFFLCHHKGGAGAFARYLKLLLLELMGAAVTVESNGRRSVTKTRSWMLRKRRGIWSALKLAVCTKQTVFFDCDDLDNLDVLFSVVETSVETLVVIQSRNLLTRPWCIGEIVTAHSRQVKVVRLSFADFSEPSDTFIEDYENFVDIGCLGPHGIDKAMVQDTLRWLRELPSLELPEPLSPGELRSVASHLIKGGTGNSVHQPALAPIKSTNTVNQSRSKSVNTNSIVAGEGALHSHLFIVADYSNTEALASALVLCQMMMPSMAGHLNMMPMVLPQGMALPTKVSVCAFAFSSGCFLQPSFVEALLDASQLQVHCMPVVVEEGFRFPVTPDAHEEIRTTVRRTSELHNIMETPEALINVISSVFKEIAVTFAPQYSGTDEELMLKAADIARRLRGKSLNRLSPPSRESVVIKRLTM